MLKLRGAATLFACGFVLACESSVEADIPNPVPLVGSTEPGVIVPTGTPIPVTVVGMGFVDGAQAYWDGDARPTEFVSETALTVTLVSSDADTPGTVPLTVANPEPGGGTSAAYAATVGSLVPVIQSISPVSADVASFIDLTVTGSAFAVGPLGAVIQWNGQAVPTTVLSSTELSARLPDYLVHTATTAAISVVNPPPGGGVSGTLPFTTHYPVPAITLLSPSSAFATKNSIVQVVGTGFVHTSAVFYDGALIPSTWSFGSIRVSLPGASNRWSDTISLYVQNPGPGGGTSNTVTVPVLDPSPRISSISATWRIAGTPSFPLTVNGGDFAPHVTVTLNGQPRSLDSATSTRLQLTVPASDIASEGPVDVVVANAPYAPVATTSFGVVPVSPSSASIAFLRAPGTLLASSVDESFLLESNRTPVGHVDAGHGQWIAAYGAGNAIVIYDFRTGTSTSLTHAGFTFAGAPRFSADDTWVYIWATIGSSVMGAWRLRIDGSAAEEVRPAASYAAPDHADARIVFVSPVADTLRVLDLGTSAEVDLGVFGRAPRWSPDDQWIAYVAGGQLRAIRPDGSGDRLIHSGPFQATFDWSNDGASIVIPDTVGVVKLVSFSSGTITSSHPELGQVWAVAFF